ATGKLSSKEADCYIMQLISGLSYLHSLNITHRDISPSNSLLTTSGILKIANFTSSEHLKPSNNFLGSTMPYIAPEVFVEKMFDGKAVDIWAVGVVYMDMRRMMRI
ncbi:kinase-like protein, partial [Cadophora sp. DSE1049]